ncbi:trigger factor [Paramaledivibacter caminithermalis]|jgi:trigger factor|uniref:Trigger factor n=1 Tax=Paramaledivibacter caminithermalis (strain DSM 15212 / CIP 107654 / DViRD3) TaxID=1121301 RepID=A0A1M6PUJ8_PARC5|nr:trigger factor [Paramaledivibacter caminithermalis]SHK11615.1 trigger factor [Paramaledivibacter caminithermalis DSM 15212]
MDSTIVKKEGNKVTLQITVRAEDFKKAVQKSYLKNRKKFNIPGFRKGKAPRKIIEMQYGEGVFYEDAINIVLPEKYDKAVEKHNLEPVDRPDIDIDKIEKDKDLVFTATVTVKPEVSLGDYKGIEVEKIEYNVTDEDVNEEIEKMRDMNSRLISIEDRPVQKDDTVIIDYKGFVGDQQFEGGTAENQTLVIGSNTFIPGFEDQLINANVGDEVEVNVTFPEEYHAENLAGKDAVFYVKIKEIKFKELPELDDEFAKDVSEFDTLEELKNDKRKQMEEISKNRAEKELREKVLDKVVENAEVDIPEAMVDTEIDNMLRDFDFQLRYQGLDLQKYLEFTKGNIEDLRKQMKDDAYNRVKTSLTLEAIGKAEDIEVTDEDLEKEFEKMAESHKTTVEKLKESFKQDNFGYIKNTIKVRKTIDFLVKNAKIA